MTSFSLCKHVVETENKGGNKKCTFLIMQYTNFNQIVCTGKMIRIRTMYDWRGCFFSFT